MGREAEPTAVAEAEADPYYGSYGYGGLSYGGYGRSYGGYGRSYGLSSYGGYGRSYGGYGGYGRGYYGKREAEAAPEAAAAPMEAMVATGPTAATDALTVMATESRQQPEHPTPHEQPRIAQYELNKKQVLDLLYLDPL